jgi:glycosyltransferase involved in cell wall biosynthesis
VLSVGRLETLKRVDLAIRAVAKVRGLRLAVVGEGSQRAALERLAAETGASGRVAFLGTVDDEELIRLYSNALGILFAPFDEDYGYVTLEAFLSGKPVVTCRDSGGVLEFVRDGTTGLVSEPDPEALAASLDVLAADRARASAMGDAGRELAKGITWDGVIEKLLGV